MDPSRTETQLSRQKYFLKKHLRNDENSGEYKEITFQKKEIKTPRRIQVISYTTQESKIRVEIAALKDEIQRLKRTLEEKMKAFSNIELAKIFYLDSNQRTAEDVNHIFTISKKLNNDRNVLTDLYNSDSINQLRKSNQHDKFYNDQLKTQLAFMQKEIESKRKQIQTITVSYEPGKSDKQKERIQKLRLKINQAVELHRKLKHEKESLKIDQSNIQDLERTLIEKKEKLKQQRLQYKSLKKKQSLAISEMKLKKEKLAHMLSISQALQIFEVKDNHEEKITEKNYVQETDLLIDNDFQIAYEDKQQSEEENQIQQINKPQTPCDIEINEMTDNEGLIQTDCFSETTSLAYSESYFSSSKISKNRKMVSNIIKAKVCNTHQADKFNCSLTESTSIADFQDNSASYESTSSRYKHNKNLRKTITETKLNQDQLFLSEQSEFDKKYNDNYSTSIVDYSEISDSAESSKKNDVIEHSQPKPKEKTTEICQDDDISDLSSSSDDSLSLY